MDLNTSEVWVETANPQGRPYFYHLRTRETKWTKPDNVLVIKQEDLPKLAEKLGVQTTSAGGTATSASAAESANSGNVNQIANGSANGAMQQSQQVAFENAATQQVPFGVGSPSVAAVSSTTTPSGNAAAGVPGANFSTQRTMHPGLPPGIAGAPATAQMPQAVSRPPWMPPSTLGSAVPAAGFPPAGFHGGLPAPHFMMGAGGMFPTPPASLMMPGQQPGFMPNPHAGMFMPPGMMPFMSYMPQQPSKPLASANDWTEYKTPDHRPYWYNSKTSKSSWEKPAEVAEAEKMQKAAAPTKKADAEKPIAGESATAAAAITSDKPKPKPISTKAVPGTAWCVVWTNDGKHFFYNPTTKTSVWKLPLDLATHPDVDSIVARGPDVQPQKPTAATEKTEVADLIASKVTDAGKKVDSPAVAAPAAAASSVVAAAPADTTASLMLKADTREGAIAVERNAAKERENIPLADRIERFQKLLEEKGVEPFSTWEKELNKIVFDPRYLLINSKERKEAFDAYCSKKIESTREEKRRKQKETMEAYFQMMRDSAMTSGISFTEFRSKLARDERFKAVERYTDREDYFRQYLNELRDKEREEKREKVEKAKKDFLELLASVEGLHRKSDWFDVKKRIADDPRYAAVDASSQRSAYFVEYRRTLAKKPKRKPSPGEILTDDDDDDAGKSVVSGDGGEKRQRKKSADRHDGVYTKHKRRSAERQSSSEKLLSKSKQQGNKRGDDKAKSDRHRGKRSRGRSDVDREDADEDDRGFDADKDRRRDARRPTAHGRKDESDSRSGSRSHRQRDTSKRTYRRSGSRTPEIRAVRKKADDDDVDKDRAVRASADRPDDKKFSKKKNRADNDDELINVSDTSGREKYSGRRHDASENGGSSKHKKRHRSKTPVDADDISKPKSSSKSLKRRSTLSPVEENEKNSKRSVKKRKTTTSDDEKMIDADESKDIKDADDSDADPPAKYSLKETADFAKAAAMKKEAVDAINDDYDDEQRAVAAAEAERQARFDASLRKRREEVEQKMSSINMETQRERQQSKLNEARAAYQQLLNDHIRSTEYDFHDARKKLKKSKNYDDVVSSILDKAEREALFDSHIAALKEKKKERFFAMLREHNVQIDSKWSKVQPAIADDARYDKFSSSERKCEKAFREYRDQVLRKEARAEFKQMLVESAALRFSLTQPDPNSVSGNSSSVSNSGAGGGVSNKMLEKLLSNDKDAWLELEVQLEDDKRYKRMGQVDENERHDMILDYVVELTKRAVSAGGGVVGPNQSL